MGKFDLSNLFLPRRLPALVAAGLAAWIAPISAYAARPLGDGAVVDAARGIAYVAQPQGGIEALDLATGKAVWHSAAAARPLALVDGKLLAQDEPGAGGALRVATLDAATGAEKARTELPLPAGLAASVTDTLRGTFRARAAALSGASGEQGSIVLAWTATVAPPLRGFLAPDLARAPIDGPAPAAPAAKAGGFRRGAARFDPVTGRLVPVAEPEIAGLAAAIDRNLAPAGPTEAGAAGIPAFASIDGLHALASERVAGSLHTYRWSISDRAAGTVIAVLDMPVSLAPFVVADGKVIYLAQPSMRREDGVTLRQPLRLRALDLATGGEVWQAVVRDSVYRGPIPP